MNKTVLITGASRGIGAEIAKVFAQNGYTVLINYNKSQKEAEALLKLLKDNGCSAHIIKADVSKIDEAEHLVCECLKLVPQIDVLVNNAGVSLNAPFNDCDIQKGIEVINTNLIGTMAVTKYVSDNMIKHKKGKIINISSVWGICGASCEVYYSASKAGVIGFTKALSKELAPSGITVNAVAPGVIKTDMNNNLSKKDMQNLIDEIPLKRLGSSYEIAKTVFFLASGDADYITGQTINISGGFLI